MCHFTACTLRPQVSFRLLSIGTALLHCIALRLTRDRHNFYQWLPLLQSCEVPEPHAKQAAARLTEQDVLLSELFSATTPDTLASAGVSDPAQLLANARKLQEIAAVRRCDTCPRLTILAMSDQSYVRVCVRLSNFRVSLQR